MSRSKAFRLGFRFSPLTVKLFGFREPMLSQVDMLIPAIGVGEIILPEEQVEGSPLSVGYFEMGFKIGQPNQSFGLACTMFIYVEERLIA